MGEDRFVRPFDQSTTEREHVGGTSSGMADREQLRLIKHGVAGWNALRAQHPHYAVGLTEADLTGADLVEANLLKAVLDRAQLGGADLSGAHLFGAQLVGANL